MSGISSNRSMPVVLLVIAIIVGGVLLSFYIFSDVFRTKVDIKVADVTKWTPGNIAKYPKEYLHYCKQQTLETIEKLKSSEIAVSQNRSKLTRTKDEAKRKVGIGQKALSELKNLFLTADAASDWPAEWEGSSREKSWVKEQIVGLHAQIQNEERSVVSCNEGINQYDAQLARIKQLRSDASAQLNEIDLASQRIEVEELSGQLKDQLMSIQSAQTVLLTSFQQADDSVDLEKLADKEQATVSDEEFERIMQME